MADPTDLLRTLVADDAERSSARESAEEQRKKDAEHSASYRARILAGETTGDDVADFVAFHHGSANQTECARLKEVNEALQGKRGELLMVRYTRHERYRYGGCFGGDDTSSYRWSNYYHLAILEGDALVFSRTKNDVVCSLPLTRYAGLESRFNLVKGTLSEDWEGKFRLCDSRHVREHEYGLIIGDQKVEEALKDEVFSPIRDARAYHLLLESLGRLVLTPEDESADESAEEN